MSEKVTECVRPALFLVYAMIGTVVIAVLGFVGWDVVSDIKTEIKLEIKTEIEESIVADIKQKRSEIIDLIAESRYLASQASEIVLQLEDTLKQFEPQASQLEETISKVNSLNIEAKNMMALYSTEIKPLTDNFERLSSQLKALAEQVGQLNLLSKVDDNSISAIPVDTADVRQTAILSVISEASKVEQEFKERNRIKVFFQLAGAPRGQAEELSKVLQQKGYSVPGEDREPSASRKHKVRYFHFVEDAPKGPMILFTSN